MIIKSNDDIAMLKEAGKMCAYIRDKVAEYARVGMSTMELDVYAGRLFKELGFLSAPRELYNFPGNTCLSVNSCVAHGIPMESIVLKDGDSLNVDVCGSLNGYYADCGKSVVVGTNFQRQAVCDCAKEMFVAGLEKLRPKTRFNEMGKVMEAVCKSRGFYPVKKLSGHGIGKGLHEKPKHIHCHYTPWDHRKFSNGLVVAIETFVSTNPYDVYIGDDDWSWICPKNALTAQYEHTVIITEKAPIILTE